MTRVVEGKLDATGLRFTLVVSRFNSLVTERLLDGALDALRRHGADPAALTVVRVPGAFELPVAVARVVTQDPPDAVVALGALIRGATPHFDHLSAAVTR